MSVAGYWIEIKFDYSKINDTHKLETSVLLMAECSHHDETRKKVGVTALGVAALRHIESQSDNPLVVDPFARDMAASEGFEWIKAAKESKGERAESSMVFGLAVRSRKIDDEICRYLRSGIRQVCVPGAGLDCRPWRIQSYFKDDLSILKDVSWFELDFPEMFEHKMRTITSFNAFTECKSYASVTADLSLPSWTESLTSAGFNPNEPSVILLEGFTSYLTPEELTLFFEQLRLVTAVGSVLIATFLTDSQSVMKISYHRSYTADPSALVLPFGWHTKELRELNDIGETEYQRHCELPVLWKSYKIMVAERI